MSTTQRRGDRHIQRQRLDQCQLFSGAAEESKCLPAFAVEGKTENRGQRRSAGGWWRGRGGY